MFFRIIGKLNHKKPDYDFSLVNRFLNSPTNIKNHTGFKSRNKRVCGQFLADRS